MARASFFAKNCNLNFQKIPAMSIDTPKIRKNVDLIYAFSSCPMGKPLDDCPFIPYYKLDDEQEQIMQIETIPQDELNRMRAFHRDCVQHYRERRRKRSIKLSEWS